jgi:CheY-like chemotaxis protein
MKQSGQAANATTTRHIRPRELTMTTTTTPGARAPSLHGWPLLLVLEQALGQAGLRLVAIHDPDPNDIADQGGRGTRAARTARADQPMPELAVHTPRVLLVDDNTNMRRVLRGLLEDAGMQVVGEAADGLDGVAQAEMLRPDVVLMDWRMPELDGLAATARIRQQLPEVQVVMFSLVEGIGGGELARQAGTAAFVAKGAPVEQVCAAVLAAWRSP